MDEFYLKCPYCDTGKLKHDVDGFKDCEECGEHYDVRKEVLTGRDFETSDGVIVSSLRVAVRHGWHDEIRVLIESGFDVNRVEFDGRTSLKFAVDHIGVDNQEVFVNTALLLIEKGADVNICDSSNNCPLHSAVHFACLTVVESLINHGADVNAAGKEDMTPLHYCGDPPEVYSEVPEDERAIVGSDEFWEHFAERQKEIAMMLLSAGADPNAQQSHGWTPLSRIASKGGNAEIAKMLIGHGADKNHRSESGFSPLGYARSKENVSVRHLVVAKTLADLGAADRRPGMCFVATAVYGSENCVPVLVLRWYRDHILVKRRAGQMFIQLYNTVGPKLAHIVSVAPFGTKLFRTLLNAVVSQIRRTYQLKI